jgi:GTPase SAR1 family protein
MSLQPKTIQYDLHYLRQEFLEILHHLSDGVRTENIKNALGKQLIKYLETQTQQILTRLEADCCLVVIGDFKRGKSTLINALLGETVVTTDVTTETVTINQIRHGSPLKHFVYLSDGGRVKIEPEELKSEHLKTILENLPQPVSHVNIEAPIEWLKGLCLVDTPGTGDILKRFDRQVHDYLLQADAVIFVLSALSPFSESESAFLKYSVIPQDFPKIFFVLNMLDNLTTEEQADRLLNSTQNKIRLLFPDAKLFGLSAYDEFCRLQSLDRPNPITAERLAAAFDDFRQSLQKSIHLNRDLIQLDRAIDNLDQMLKEFEENLARLDHAMHIDQSRLTTSIAQCQDKTSELFTKIEQHKQVMRNEIKQMSKQTATWMNEFIARLKDEAIAKISKFKVDDIRRHFVFFLTNKFSKALSECLNHHKFHIVEIVNKTNKGIFEDIKLLTNLGIADQETAQDNTADQLVLDMDIAELLIDCQFSHSIVVSVTKQIEDLITINQLNKYQQKLQNHLPQLKELFHHEIDLLYNSIINQIEQKMESVYQQNIETSLSVMQQAQELRAQEIQKVTVTHEALKDVSLLLEDTRKSLKPLKQKLCSEDVLSDLMSMNMAT